MGNERWTTDEEIKQNFVPLEFSESSGPTVYYENGINYISSGDEHFSYEGATGMGKSQAIMGAITNAVRKKNNIICIDPKGELLDSCYWAFSDDYDIYVFDFRDPVNSPNKFNILLPMYTLYMSSDQSKQDTAYIMMNEFIDALLSNMTEEKYWTASTHGLMIGDLLVLFERAKCPEEVTLENYIRILEQSSSITNLRMVYDTLSSDSLAKRHLSTYVGCKAEDTRSCIYSIAMTAINVFSRSRGLISMVSDGRFNYLDLNPLRNFAIFFKTPDESNADKPLLANYTQQITQHLIRTAQELGGRLPIPTLAALDELGSIGKSMPSLCNLAVAGRSRGVRLCLSLQDHAQLETLFSKTVAETIYSCIKTSFLFSSNNFKSLEEYSMRCGDRFVETENGQLIRAPLITPAELYSLPVGTCLVMTKQYKFISHLPLYKDLYKASGSKTPNFKPEKIKKRKLIDLTDLAKEKPSITSTFNLLGSKNQKSGEEKRSENKRPYRFSDLEFIDDLPTLSYEVDKNKVGDKTLEEVIAELDKQIAEIEAAEKAEKEKASATDRKIIVLVSCEENKIERVSKIIYDHYKDLPVAEIKRKLKKDRFIRVSFKSNIEATKLVSECSQVGASAWIDAR